MIIIRDRDNMNHIIIEFRRIIKFLETSRIDFAIRFELQNNPNQASS